MAGSWTVVLNGVALQSNQNPLPPGVLADQVMGCLSEPPAGMGVPPLRVEDQTFAQRDGVAHFKDWYDARIITLENVTIDSEEACAECSVRADVRDLMEAWARHCADTELVIFTDCHGTDPDRSLVGPFGVRGRPRVADLVWHTTAGVRAATATLRFDGVDHRLYILDESGTPGSGQECQELAAAQESVDYSIYESAVLGTSGLAGYWSLNETSGTVAFDHPIVIDSQDGDYQAETLLGQEPLANGLSWSMNGVVNSTAYAGAGEARSVELWWRAQEPGQGGTLWNLTTGAPGLPPYTMTTTQIRINNTTGIGAGALDISAPNQAILTDGDPHHVVFTSNSGTNLYTLYIDGVNVQTWADGSGTIPFNDIGVYLPRVLGNASDFAVYTSAISAVTVADHYALGPVPDLVFEDVAVSGNVCVPVIITFTGPLTNPAMVTPDGSFVGIGRTIDTGQTVTLDTSTGIATLTTGTITSDVSQYVTGDPFFSLSPEVNQLAATFEAPGFDAGTVEVCWRPAVISG